MAGSFVSFHEVSDLCIGKPPLRCLPAAATVGEALSALKRSGEPYISVWSCSHHRRRYTSAAVAAASTAAPDACRCVGKVSVVDVVCFLCREDNLSRPLFALDSPVSVLLPKDPELVNVKHLDPHSRLERFVQAFNWRFSVFRCHQMKTEMQLTIRLSDIEKSGGDIATSSRFNLLEAVDCILEGAHHIVVPRRSRRNFNLQQQYSYGSLHHTGQEYCWINHEDVIRFFFNSINVFYPLPGSSIESLNLIDKDFLTVHYDDPVLPNLPAIQSALSRQMVVAVVDDEGRLIGEISSDTLSSCGETVAAAIATLSAGDLMAYIDSSDPPEDLVQLVKSRLEERNLEGMLELMEEDGSVMITPSSSIASDSSSSDDDLCSIARTGKLGGTSGQTVNRTEAIACHPGSSLAAVMIQALTHRVNYVWVINDNYIVAGMITFSGILNVLHIDPKS